MGERRTAEAEIKTFRRSMRRAADGDETLDESSSEIFWACSRVGTTVYGFLPRSS